MKDVIDVTTIVDTIDKIRCDCGYDISTLPPDKTWRTIRCYCGTIWWVKPSGRRFEKHREHKDLDY